MAQMHLATLTSGPTGYGSPLVLYDLKSFFFPGILLVLMTPKWVCVVRIRTAFQDMVWKQRMISAGCCILMLDWNMSLLNRQKGNFQKLVSVWTVGEEQKRNIFRDIWSLRFKKWDKRNSKMDVGFSHPSQARQTSSLICLKAHRAHWRKLRNNQLSPLYLVLSLPEREQNRTTCGIWNVSLW